jgi:DNA-binding GntR family transcriptional regulator
VLRLLYRNDLRELDDLHEIVDALKKKDGQSLGDSMKDGRSMVLQKMGGKKDDR